MDNFSNLLFEPLRRSWESFAGFVPNLLAMIIIFIGGIAAAWFIMAILGRILSVLRFDKGCDEAGITAIIRKTGISLAPSALAARLAFWVVVIVAFMIGLAALDLETVDRMTNIFFLYLPRAVSAFIILIAGYTIAGFASRAILIAAVNSGYHNAKLLAETVRLLLVVLIVAMALEQLQIAPMIVATAFTIVFGGIVLALAIAFGVGGIDTARKILGKGTEEEEKEPGRDLEHL